MPADRATMDMKAMYGNIQRVMCTAASMPCAPAGRPLAMAQTSQGASSTPSTETSSSTPASAEATLSINARVGASPCSARVAASTGTKAWLKAPSANRRRKRLGMRNATLKASVRALAPNRAAIINSRTSPVTREAKVKADTTEADRSRLTPQV